MSLINDALKRASQSDRNRPRQAETRASMEPVTHRRGRALPILLAVCVVVALGLAGWFFWQWWSASHPAAPVKVETAAIRPPKPAPKPTPAPAPVHYEAVPKPASNTPPLTAAPTPTPTPTPAVVPAPSPAPDTNPPPAAKPAVVEAAWPVDLRLMGIFFSKNDPRALINRRMVAVGDDIDGIRVTKIEHDQVTVEWNGQVKVLYAD